MMRKIVLAMVCGVAFVACGAGVSGESKVILPPKAEYKISQIIVNGEMIEAPIGAMLGIDDTKIYGNTGCNSYFTDFKRVDSGNIEVSTNGGATKMMCDKDLIRFENIFLQHLVGTFSVVKSSDSLKLNGKKMQVLLEK